MMQTASGDAISMAELREMMERQLAQMVHLVNDLLDIPRLTSGQMTLKKERVALKEIIDGALEAP